MKCSKPYCHNRAADGRNQCEACIRYGRDYNGVKRRIILGMFPTKCHRCLRNEAMANSLYCGKCSEDTEKYINTRRSKLTVKGRQILERLPISDKMLNRSDKLVLLYLSKRNRVAKKGDTWIAINP